jgi:uncharacterized protein with PIN domain
MSGKNHIRFIADVMVGRLARYLRMAGYDVVYMNDADDGLIIKIALEEDRVVLTRDTMMLERKEFKNGILRSVFITDDSLAEQLLQVKSAMDLSLEPDLMVCLVCNSRLEEVDKENTKSDVPPYVYKTQNSFKYCRNCGKYYWRGTHYDYIRKFFNDLKSGG